MGRKQRFFNPSKTFTLLYNIKDEDIQKGLVERDNSLYFLSICKKLRFILKKGLESLMEKIEVEHEKKITNL